MHPYILFKPHLEVQIILLKHWGQRGWRAVKMRGAGCVVVGSAGIPLYLVMQGISRPHYQTEALAAELSSSRLKASAHPLHSSHSLSRFSSWDDSGEAMSCFIHSDASHTILNPSHRRGRSSANFNKFVQLQSQRQQMPWVEVSINLLQVSFPTLTDGRRWLKEFWAKPEWANFSL